MLPYLAHHCEKCWEPLETFRPQGFEPKPQPTCDARLSAGRMGKSVLRRRRGGTDGNDPGALPAGRRFRAEHAEACPCGGTNNGL